MQILNRIVRLLPVAVSFVLLGCSAPKTLPEFRTWARTSSYMKRKEYAVPNLTMAAAGEKLRAFSDKCFKKEIHSSVGVNSGYGVSKHRSVATYNPKILKESRRVSLIVQREDSDSVGYPDGGVYELLVEITPGAKGVQVFAATFSLRLEDRVLDDVESWLRGTGQFCPF